MNHQEELDDSMFASEYYSDGIYPQLPPEEGPSKQPQRRRRKKKSTEGAMRKRKLSEEQVNMLEQSFRCEHKLETERKDRLAAELGMDPRQVAVWFQNRRARCKVQKLEQEYSKLKAEHDTAVVEKCRLETELLKLKEQLDEAKMEIRRLSERTEGFSRNSNSPSSSTFSMDELLFVGMQDLDNVHGGYGQGLMWW